MGRWQHLVPETNTEEDKRKHFLDTDLEYDISAAWDIANPPLPPEDCTLVNGFIRSPDGYGSAELALILRTVDGKWALLEGWCDTTGWDCQADAEFHINTDRHEVERYITDEHWRFLFEDEERV